MSVNSFSRMGHLMNNARGFGFIIWRLNNLELIAIDCECTDDVSITIHITIILAGMTVRSQNILLLERYEPRSSPVGIPSH